MINTLTFAKTLAELSTTLGEAYPATAWSGAVNMLLVEDSLVFIKRSDDMPSHKGQIGFIGGHKNADEINPIDTALRELFEEANIFKDNLKVIGIMEPTRSKSVNSSFIMPVLSRYTETKKELLKQVRSNGEWSDLIITPLEYLREVNNWQTALIPNTSHLIGFCPLTRKESLFHSRSGASDYVLWGASAKMVWNFFKCYK